MAFRRGYLHDLVRLCVTPEVVWPHLPYCKNREGRRTACRGGKSLSCRDHYQIFKVAQPVTSAPIIPTLLMDSRRRLLQNGDITLQMITRTVV